MNNYSKLLQQSLVELNEWLFQRPNMNPNDVGFYERIKNLLNEASDSEPQKVESIIKKILYILTDSAPDEAFRGEFLPSFHQAANVVQRKK